MVSQRPRSRFVPPPSLEAVHPCNSRRPPERRVIAKRSNFGNARRHLSRHPHLAAPRPPRRLPSTIAHLNAGSMQKAPSSATRAPSSVAPRSSSIAQPMTFCSRSHTMNVSMTASNCSRLK
eukprot:353654-Chlamydomonas_euryale.AAC.10